MSYYLNFSNVSAGGFSESAARGHAGFSRGVNIEIV